MKTYPGISHDDPRIRREAIAMNRSNGKMKPNTYYQKYLDEHDTALAARHRNGGSDDPSNPKRK